MKFSKYAILSASAMMWAAQPAQAASIIEESGFGPVSAISTCKTGSSVAAFTTGTLLSTGDVTGGCVGYFSIDLDTIAQTITLTALEVGNYESGYFEISGISESVITGLSTVSYVDLFGPTIYTDPTGAPEFSDVPVPVLSFTGSSIRIEFSSFGNAAPNDQFAYNGFVNGQAVFSYTAIAVVPEPASWAMMIGGFALAGTAMRRRKAALSFA